MDNGINTVCFERGENLSGGQRTRLELARCFYLNKSIFVLDDPLKSIDPNTALNIVENTLKKHFKSKTIFVSSSNPKLVKFADRVIILEKGKIVFNGRYQDAEQHSSYIKLQNLTKKVGNEIEAQLEDLMLKDPSTSKKRQNIQRVQPISKLEGIPPKKVLNNKKQKSEKEGGRVGHSSKDDLEDLNIDQYGRISLNVYVQLFWDYKGFIGMVLPILFLLGGMGFIVMSQSSKSQFVGNFTPNAEGNKTALIPVILYYLGGVGCVYLAFNTWTQLGASAGFNIHNKMMMSVLHADTSSFIEVTQTGAIINRFTNDIDKIDRELPSTLINILFPIIQLIVTIISFVMLVKNSIFSIFVIIFLVVALTSQNTFLKTNNNIVRLANETKSEIVQLSTAISTGIVNIRAMKKEEYFQRLVEEAVDNNVKLFPLSYGIGAGYSFFIFMLNFILFLVPGLLYIYYQIESSGVENTALNLGNIIFFLQRIQRVGSIISRFITITNKAETQLVNYERCKDYEKIEPEPGYIKDIPRIKSCFCVKTVEKNEILERVEPKSQFEGKIEFRGVYSKYPNKQAYALQNISFSIQPGQKIAVIGRSGAGKSSLIKLLWRCLRPSLGEVLIDGKSQAKMDLKYLRNRISIVNQEPFLFNGTLIENIDPKLVLDDPEKTSKKYKLEESRMLEMLEGLGFDIGKLDGMGLDYKISKGGSGLSFGEIQMVNFVRECLYPKNIAIFDEATSSLDKNSEKQFLNLFKDSFKDSTVFMIAHRLEIIRDFELLIVLDDAEMIYFGSVDGYFSN